MAGAVLERELTAAQTGGVTFSVATEADDAEIRRLLRDTPMPGRISLSFEREPNFFADANIPSETRQTIVARDRGRLVCVGSCAIRPRYVNGKPRRVGYLGGLRLDVQSAGRFSILRRGYDVFRQLQQEAPADFYFTSIAADNERARAFLERGLPGMPRYEFICEFVTLTISTGACRQFRQTNHQVSHPASPNELLRFLNEHNCAYQFAPFYEPRSSRRQQNPSSNQQQHEVNERKSDRRLEQQKRHRAAALHDAGALHCASLLPRGRGVRQPYAALTSGRWQAPFSLAPEADFPSDFCVFRTGQKIEACGALWDQRPFKQVVVRGYSTILATARPLLNALSKLTRQPRLPALGETLSIAFASHLASKTDASLLQLIQKLLNSARQRGIEILTLGFASYDPRLASIRRHFRCREYVSRLYVVSWPGIGGTARELDDQPLAPEVALL